MLKSLRILPIALAGAALVASAPMAMAEYPEPGKQITVIVPYAPGGPSDIGTRTLIPFLEQELGEGTVFQVVNKPGATTQIANTELAASAPDGYTIAVVPVPTISMTYLDADRQAAYGREDFTPIAHYTSEANLLIVPADSPYQTVEEFIEAAKANPTELKLGTSGLMSNTHLAGIGLEEATGAEFAFVHFDGAAPLATAMLGGNLDAAISGILATMPHERAGTMRVLGTFDNKKTKFFPNADPIIDQGYNVYSPTSFGVWGPADMPPEVIDTLSSAIERAMANEEFQAKIAEVTLTPDYMDSEEFDAFWADTEKRMSGLLEMAKQRQQ